MTRSHEAAVRYDRTSHERFWAKEIMFGDAPDNTLNCNIRMLGRKGVPVLNAVAGSLLRRIITRRAEWGKR